MANIARWKARLKQQVARGDELLAGPWGEPEVTATCRSCGHRWRDRFWTPWQTLWTFLLQVLHTGSSCRQAVALTLAGSVAAGVAAASPDPSAYSQARRRLPLAVLVQALKTVGEHLRGNLSELHTWCGRHVWLVDGTSCSMPDTPELQDAFGQPDGQAKGCGFPVATIVAMFCWASGAVLEAAIGSYRQSELPLWRSLWHLLRPGEIVLADRFYCTYADLASLIVRGCDGVFRLHQARPCDFRMGRRLGANDRLVTWQRPVDHNCPRGMAQAQLHALPAQLTVRMLRFVADIPGFRSRCIHVATSLLDPVAYPAEQIGALYRDRWLIELRFRDIKITLGMDVLRGKTPDIIRKEIHMHLLAYNLIRCLMWQAAAEHGADLRCLSFAATVDRLNAMGPYLWLYQGTARAEPLHRLLLEWIAHDPNPDRPNRVEPRVRKRRPKQYPLLNKPRYLMRKALLCQ